MNRRAFLSRMLSLVAAIPAAQELLPLLAEPAVPAVDAFTFDGVVLTHVSAPSLQLPYAEVGQTMMVFNRGLLTLLVEDMKLPGETISHLVCFEKGTWAEVERTTSIAARSECEGR